MSEPIISPKRRNDRKTERPVIGVTLDIEHGAEGQFSKYDYYALRENYCSAIAEAGGLPITLPHFPDNALDYLALIDGLVVTGGAFDVDPALFGATIRHATVTTKANRTKFELTLVNGAIERNIPILGICGGEQLLAVALRGTLIQHIPDAIPNALAHEQPNPRNEPGHTIRVIAGTKLAEIAERAGIKDLDLVPVNSAHHQAVAMVPPPVYVNAVAPDGVIEGIEHRTLRFCLGVQWHPEFSISPLDRAIFREFVAECGKNGRDK